TRPCCGDLWNCFGSTKNPRRVGVKIRFCLPSERPARPAESAVGLGSKPGRAVPSLWQSHPIQKTKFAEIALRKLSVNLWSVEAPLIRDFGRSVAKGPPRDDQRGRASIRTTP